MVATMKKPSQAYRGNGAHDWETVVNQKRAHDDYGSGHTFRLRVPSGWLYSVVNADGESPNTVFVPLPAVVKHKV